MRYVNYLDPHPSVESFRLSHSPRDGLGVVLICPWVILRGESGANYQFMRAYALPEMHTVINFGAYRGIGELDKQAPLLISFSEHPAVEAYTVTEDATAIAYASPSHRLRLGLGQFEWVDAGGRIDLRAELMGQPCTFFVPEQTGIPHPILSRSHFGYVTGTIDDDPVRGIWTHDFIFSRPGLTFGETHFTRVLHNYWMNWMVEYDDGTFEGGHAWRGRPGTGFAAAHHVVDGVSHARSDARITMTHTERGSIDTLTLQLGDELVVELDQHGSLDWPIHTYGTVRHISRDKTVVRSWNYSEQFPHNWGLVEDYQLAHAKLFGQYPSLQGLLSGASVKQGLLRFDTTPTAN